MRSFPRRTASSRALGAVVATLLVGSVAACGSDDSPPDSAPAESESASESSSPTASESESPSPSETATPSESASATASPSPSATEPSPADTLRGALLTAEELPGLNAETSWTAGRTAAVGTRPFGWCAQFDALTIGAREGVQRGFRSSTGEAADRAGQQVLDFVDQTNAIRAERVFRSWHRDCRRGDAEPRPIQDVAAGSGTAWWYLSSTERDGGQWEAFGVARSGNRVTLLRMQHRGQDHSYEPGQDPLEVALRTAAAKLG